MSLHSPLESRHQDGRSARDLLGIRPVKDKGKREQTSEMEVWHPWEEQGKN